MHKILGLCLALAFVLSTALWDSAGAAGQKCGGFAGPTCGAKEFCQRPAGICFFPDMEGTCTVVPFVCGKIYLPVCGCDGKTYGNDCERQQAKVSLAHEGKCAF
jgi:hypothetical protein